MHRVSHLRLVRPANQQTVTLLESLLAEAKRGDEVTDICLTYRRRSGVEDVAFSGVYLRDPAQALQAAMVLTRALTTIAAARREAR